MERDDQKPWTSQIPEASFSLLVWLNALASQGQRSAGLLLGKMTKNHHADPVESHRL